jgi:hypothetical protein
MKLWIKLYINSVFFLTNIIKKDLEKTTKYQNCSHLYIKKGCLKFLDSLVIVILNLTNGCNTLSITCIAPLVPWILTV